MYYCPQCRQKDERDAARKKEKQARTMANQDGAKAGPHTHPLPSSPPRRLLPTITDPLLLAVTAVVAVAQGLTRRPLFSPTGSWHNCSGRGMRPVCTGTPVHSERALRLSRRGSACKTLRADRGGGGKGEG
jgi:hypothetical protein